MVMTAETLDQLKDDIATALCREWCSDHCQANEQNDICYCTEGAILAAEIAQKHISHGYYRPRFCNAKEKKT